MFRNWNGFHRSATLAGVLGALVLLQPTPASAEIELVKTDDWRVFVNGRMQAFLNYNKADGAPAGPRDANGNRVTVLSGGDKSPVALDEGADPNEDSGEIQDLRVRTGFVGNVIGFGFAHRLDESNEVSGYTAVTTYIASTARRKYAGVIPDWRESYLKVAGDWGSVTAGRTLVLFSRGATEITYLYGYRYGLGWVGSVSSNGDGGPGAGHVGFGILGNGFGAGIAYATPDMGGAQLTVGVYDANNIPGSGTLERTQWPRGEGEFTYESKLGEDSMFKLFANGAYQKIYENDGFRSQDIIGVGFGGRVELGLFRLGLAGHRGKGIGINFALEPNESGWNSDLPGRPFRDVDGYSAHLQIAPSSKFDFMAAAGITRVLRLPEDKQDSRDSDGDDLDRDGLADADETGATPATPTTDDDGVPGPDSVGFVPVKHQIGISFGGTYHVSPNLHLTAEYFRAMYKWHTAIPVEVGAEGVEQNFDAVNLGVTYDF